MEDLRLLVGDIEFGYRIQGLLAHVFMRLGATVIELNAQGHPDLVINLDGRIPIEVEAAPTVIRSHTVKLEDIEAIKGLNDSGYLAVLDCTLPIAWILLAHPRLKRQGPGPVSLVTLWAMSDDGFSRACTDEFITLIIGIQDRLSNLTFHLLRRRALRGQAL